ncbi:MAG: hypothetical protein OIN89_10860 [Candidatus Methanoperedens sp.]|jgi:hypothetical protein|nr:hypothetical protein [Candidatus Methanoperedens sp.]
MEMVSAKKRLEAIEKQILPSLFVGILSKDHRWLEKTYTKTLPELEAKALRLAGQCRESGECAQDDPLCDETRIRELFKETRLKLEKEHVTRDARSRFRH